MNEYQPSAAVVLVPTTAPAASRNVTTAPTNPFSLASLTPSPQHNFVALAR